jgi:phosphatidylglycerol:prolipoprotein diacylglycerol transferase
MWIAGRELARLQNAGQFLRPEALPPKSRGRLTNEVASPQEFMGNLTIVSVMTGLVGARIFHILEHSAEFAAAPWDMIFTRSGFSVLGGLIFGTVAGAFYVRRCKLPIRIVSDAAAPAMMLGYAIGRVGCQISGDGDWGIAADLALKPEWLPMWLWAQTYDNNILGVTIAAPGVYPTPIYETFLSLLCFAILWRMRKHPYRAGWLFSLYLLLAGAERLLIERIRDNVVFHIFGISATQAEMLSVGFIVLGIAGVVVLYQSSAISNHRTGTEPE